MKRETRLEKLERLVAELEAETPSEKQARAMGYPKPRPADDALGDASARAAAKLTGAGDE